MKVFILSLKEDVKKRAVLLAQCEELGLEVEIFHAIEGAMLEQSFVDLHVDNYSECMLTRGEIGCALSHQAIYKKMIDDNLPMALILEDDARISLRTLKIIKELEDEGNNDERVYLLTPPEYYCPTKSLTFNNDVTFYRVSESAGAFGYVLSQQTAKRLISINTPLKWEVDSWGLFNLLHNFEIFALIPPAVNNGDPLSHASTLEQLRALNRAQRATVRHKLKKKTAGYQFRRIRRLLRKKFQREVRY